MCSTVNSINDIECMYFSTSSLTCIQHHSDLLSMFYRWTSLLRRLDGSVGFGRNWDDFRNGFGDANGEAWLGNEYMHQLTNARSYKLRFDLEDWDGNTGYAEYASFVVTSESDNYRLLLGDYSGTASADASVDQVYGFLANNNSQFTTYDRDNDSNDALNCALDRAGHGGFWYKGCTWVGATIAYCPSAYCTSYKMRWKAFRNNVDLKTLTMKIRPN